MNPLTPIVDQLERRCSGRTLAVLTVVSVVGLVLSQGILIWYFGSMGLTLGAVAYDGDGRTVVVDESDLAVFERHYSDDQEEGWCVYGTANETHIRVSDVVHASTLSQGEREIEFTCLPETGGQVVTGENPHLLGTVHSHPSYNRSFLSRKDTMLWGRTTPVIEVMGVYTEPDGVAFFTVESMASPLRMEVIERESDPGQGNRSASGSRGIETP